MQPPPVNTVPPVRASTLQVPFNTHTQDSGSHMSQMSGPLFTEDIYSTSSSSDQEICDWEVRNITQGHTPSEALTVVMSPRPGSNSTVDYSTQGDPNQPAHSPQSGLTWGQQWILSTCKYLLPDGSRRRIHDIWTHQLHSFPDMLDNGHAAYQVELPNLEPIVEISTFLMDRLTGAFFTVYEDGYREMATTKRLLYPWQNIYIYIYIYVYSRSAYMYCFTVI